MVSQMALKCQTLQRPHTRMQNATWKGKMETKEHFKNSFPPMTETLPDLSMYFTEQQKAYALVPPNTPSFLFSFSFPSLKALMQHCCYLNPTYIFITECLHHECIKAFFFLNIF